jgi:hypothetical protein
MGAGERAVAASWDAEYAAGRYAGDPPVGFVDDILAAAAPRRLRHGVYLGCGNGRNLLPMLGAGLDLLGLDISAEAIGQLRRRRPDRAGQLIVGDLTTLPPMARYELVIGIQVFQHGARAQAHRHLAAAAARVAPGGLLCVRVNAATTDIEHHHDVVEEDSGGDYTVRYRAGPKAGLDIHFFTAVELLAILGGQFTAVMSPRLHTTHRAPPALGQWSQWEAIWQASSSIRPETAPNATASGLRMPSSEETN